MLIAKSRPDFGLVCIVQQLMAAHTSQVYSALRITNFAVTEKDGREWTRMPVRFSSHPSLRLMCDEIWQLWNVILDFKANFSMYNHVWRKCKKNKKKKLYFLHPIPPFFFLLNCFLPGFSFPQTHALQGDRRSFVWIVECRTNRLFALHSKCGTFF